MKTKKLPYTRPLNGLIRPDGGQGDIYHTLSWKKKKLITQPHLPQGAPTSPALANLCCWKLDKRLEGLSRKANIDYSRYADDLAFSGDMNLYKSNMYFRKTIEQIVNEEGFLINHTKTFTATKSQQLSRLFEGKDCIYKFNQPIKRIEAAKHI